MNRRVCLVGAEITPSEGSTFVGGHVNTVVGLCKGLSDLGWEMHIVTTPSRFLRGRLPDFSWAKIHLIKVNGKYNSLNYGLDFLVQATKAIKNLDSRHPFDLIHAHSGYFSLAIIPALAKRKIDVPALFSLYCPASLLPRRLPIDSYGIRLVALGLDKIIAVTENVKNSLTKYGVSNGKIEVIHSCFDEEAFSMNTINLKNSDASVKSPEAKRVLFVGNLNKSKGLDVFVAAAKSILRSNPNVKFIVTLHEPPERLQRARIFASRELGSSMEVFGVVNDMAKLVANVDVVVTPFRDTEGISDIPIIVLEAMAMGKTVVSSNLEGVKDIIVDGENGFTIDLHSNELAEAITNVLNDPNLRDAVGREAIMSVKRFSYSEISRKLSNLYVNIIED